MKQVCNPAQGSLPGPGAEAKWLHTEDQQVWIHLQLRFLLGSLREPHLSQSPPPLSFGDLLTFWKEGIISSQLISENMKTLLDS